MFQLVERWGRRSLLLLDMHLGMRARTGLHLHLNSFLRMPWKNPKFCTQGEILALGLFHQTGIWNKSVCGAGEIKVTYKNFLFIFCKILFLTWSTVCSGWTLWEQGYHCHKGSFSPRQKEENSVEGHLWSQENHSIFHMSMKSVLYQSWETSGEWQYQGVEIWCKCSGHLRGSC